MSSPIKPMAHYVVAVKEKKPEKTSSGIFLPESAQEKSEAAKVVAVGSAVKDVADGARVVYKNYAATTIKLDKEEYLIIKDENIPALYKILGLGKFDYNDFKTLCLMVFGGRSL